MASKLLQCTAATFATLSGFNHTACVKQPASPEVPTILFIHGFPSSSYDWRHQIDFFAKEGYGIIAPDLLGYGGSDKSSDPADYTIKKVGDNVLDIVDQILGKQSQVIAVGHDWGASVLSRMANYHPDRFSSYTFLASGYWPSGPFDIDTLIAQEIRTMGWSKFGYQKFFNESDSGAIVDAHQDSFVDLIYPEDMMKTWKEAMGPVNLTRQWLMTDTRRARAKYISEVEFATHNSIFSRENGGYQHAMNSYKAIIRGLNAPDEDKIPDSVKHTDLPVLFVAATQDPLVNQTLQNQGVKAFTSRATLQEVPAGHWPQLEQADAVNGFIKSFLDANKGDAATGASNATVAGTFSTS